MPRAVLGLGMRQAAGLKLARLLSMREKDFARLVREAEEDPLFVRLLRSGVVSRPTSSTYRGAPYGAMPMTLYSPSLTAKPKKAVNAE